MPRSVRSAARCATHSELAGACLRAHRRRDQRRSAFAADDPAEPHQRSAERSPPAMPRRTAAHAGRRPPWFGFPSKEPAYGPPKRRLERPARLLPPPPTSAPQLVPLGRQRQHRGGGGRDHRGAACTRCPAQRPLPDLVRTGVRSNGLDGACSLWGRPGPRLLCVTVGLSAAQARLADHAPHSRQRLIFRQATPLQAGHSASRRARGYRRAGHWHSPPANAW